MAAWLNGRPAGRPARVADFCCSSSSCCGKSKPAARSTLGCPHPQVYAVYGAVFIIMSYLWGWAVDGVRPDTGDWVGSAIAVAGGFLAFFWPGRS